MAKKDRVKFRLGTLNALGDSHTRPGGNKKGWLNSTRRTILLCGVLTRRRIGLVALQEFQGVQQRVFNSRMSLWGMHAIADNAVVWLRPKWKVLDRGHLNMPYFNGKTKSMPWVKLQRRSLRPSKRKVIAVLSKHNPANVHGDAEKWRQAGWVLEASWAKDMLRQEEVVAAIGMGDANAGKAKYRPYIERLGGIVAGNPRTDFPNTPGAGIDWIVGWGRIAFIKYRSSKTRTIAKLTDHPLEQAVAII